MTTFNVFINKCNKSLPIDFDALPEHVKTHIIEYGLTQKLNDSHSGEADAELAWGLVNNLAERLVAGDISKRAAGRAPEVVEATNLMRLAIKKASNMKGAEVAKLTYAQLVDMIAKGTGKSREEIMDIFLSKAKAVVAVRQKADDLNIAL